MKTNKPVFLAQQLMRTLKTKNMRSNYLIAVSILTVSNIFAQDIIIKKDNEQIKAKIIEIGTNEIKFKYWDAEDGPTITLKKDEIKSMTIKGKNNTQNTIGVTEDPMSVSNSKILDKTSSFKFNFFSPLSHHIAFSYEWMYKPGFNFEAGLGIIGPGVGDNNTYDEINIKPRGGFVKMGAKFLLGNSSDFAVEGIKYAHPLKGRYVKVEMTLNSFTRSSDLDTGRYNYYGGSYYNYTPSYLHVKRTYTSMAMNLIYGRQYILGNAITAGWYVGVGYGFENERSNVNTDQYLFSDSPQRYSHYYFGNGGLPITMTYGFNVGIILKAPKKLIGSTDDEKRYWIDKKGTRQNPKRIQ